MPPLFPVAPPQPGPKRVLRSVPSDDLDRDLARLMEDPLYWRDKDPEYAAHVERQFARAHSEPAPETGVSEDRLSAPAVPRRGTLEAFQPTPRPDDARLARGVGRGEANRAGDVAKIQRLLSATGDYVFAAPQERSGAAGEPLFNAIETYQERTGLTLDGRLTPAGETAGALAGVSEYRAPEGAGFAGGEAAEIGVSDPSERREDAYQDTPVLPAGQSDVDEDECRRLRVRAEVLRTNIADIQARIAKDEKRIEQLQRKIQRLELGTADELRDLIVDMLLDLGARFGGALGKFTNLAHEVIAEKHRREALNLAKQKLRFLRKEIDFNKGKLTNGERNCMLSRKKLMNHVNLKTTVPNRKLWHRPRYK